MTTVLRVVSFNTSDLLVGMIKYIIGLGPWEVCTASFTNCWQNIMFIWTCEDLSSHMVAVTMDTVASAIYTEPVPIDTSAIDTGDIAL